MATDARGHTVPAATDAPKRADLSNLSLSVRDVVYVANATARTTLLNALTAAGLGASASNPVYVHRGDKIAGTELEYTTDGTNWRTVYAVDPITYTRTTDYTLTGGTESPALLTAAIQVVGPAYEAEAFFPGVFSTVDADRVEFRVKLGATQMGAAYANCRTGLGSSTVVKAHMPAGSSGTVTVTAQRVGGTGTVTVRGVEGAYLVLRAIDS